MWNGKQSDKTYQANRIRDDNERPSSLTSIGKPGTKQCREHTDSVDWNGQELRLSGGISKLVNDGRRSVGKGV